MLADARTKNRGFTLIELLVVIAIIGILSAVVLASLNSARSKANDAAIQSDLNTIQTQAELYYGSGGNGYGVTNVTCSNAYANLFSNTAIARAVTAVQAINGNHMTCNNTPNAYAVSASLYSDTTKYFCIDSSGSSMKTTAGLGSNTVCSSS